MSLKKSTETFQTIIERRLSRRQLLKGSAVLAGAAVIPGCVSSVLNQTSTGYLLPTFNEVAHGLDSQLHVPEGYHHQVLLRWGDPLFSDAKPFDPGDQSAEKQLRQFGFNNDYVGFVSLPLGSNEASHGLLVVNHEYTSPELMFPGVTRIEQMSQAQAEVDIVAHGLTVVEIKQDNAEWQVVTDSTFNRRITPYTKMQMTGPAAGSERLKTLFSNDGVLTLGTYGNCAGGVTPWGTILTAEENVDEYFSGDVDSLDEARNHKRFTLSGQSFYSWSRFFERWDLNKNPNEANHVGWIVEIDPFDPTSVPEKKTALGRCKHEGCNLHINLDGRVVAYTGDDEVFEYIYRFVSEEQYQKGTSQEARAHNKRLLDAGTLSVARFLDDGRLVWLPLVYGKGPLTEVNDFHSQADVVIEIRRAADLVGATPMDRPEDIEVNPRNGKVYATLTKNSGRKISATEPSNPRAKNKAGHIIEWQAPGNDHTAAEFQWEILLLAGDPEKAQTTYHPDTSVNGWLACPDNIAFSASGDLWIATDGADKFKVADGLWYVATEGEYRGYCRRFLRAPVGAELCGPFLTPDDRTLFCSIQHPGEGSAYHTPSTRWPDFDPKLPPRPAVVAITHTKGEKIGT